MSRKKEKRSLTESDGIINNPFGDLNMFEGVEIEEDPVETDEGSTGGIVRVRLEKKGRGGKTVTVFYDFEPIPNLKKIAADLKKSLGTGARYDEDSIEIQGDNRKRAAEILAGYSYKVKGKLD